MNESMGFPRPMAVDSLHNVFQSSLMAFRVTSIKGISGHERGCRHGDGHSVPNIRTSRANRMCLYFNDVPLAINCCCAWTLLTHQVVFVYPECTLIYTVFIIMQCCTLLCEHFASDLWIDFQSSKEKHQIHFVSFQGQVFNGTVCQRYVHNSSHVTARFTAQAKASPRRRPPGPHLRSDPAITLFGRD